MRYQDDLGAMFDSLTDLTLQQRATVKERYRFLMAEYRYRCRFYTFLFYTLRMTMTVGSLAVPALLSLKSTSDSENVLYWFTWSLSLAVTTAHGLTTLFKLDKRFFMLHAIAERLRTETWQYLSLSGLYSGHYGGHKPTHKNQYVYYMTQLEKIRMKHIDEEFIRQADMGEKAAKIKEKPAVENEEGTHDTIGAGVPSPPDQAALISSPNPVMRRRESTATIGSDATVIEMGLPLSGQRDAVSEKGEPTQPILLQTSELSVQSDERR
jgi:hypothetical protein